MRGRGTVFRRLYPCKFRGPSSPRGWFVLHRWKNDPIASLPGWFQTKFCACNAHFLLKKCKFCSQRFPMGWFVWYRWKNYLITSLPEWFQTKFQNILHVTPIFCQKKCKFRGPSFLRGWFVWYRWKNPILCSPLCFKAKFWNFVVDFAALFEVWGGEIFKKRGGSLYKIKL